VVWDVVKDKTLSDDVKVGLVLDFDRVLGLELEATSNERRAAVPAEIQTLLDTREQLRKAGDYAQADALRDKIIALGYEVTDK
jgi:cysteinyl-tRNA synthetase